MEHMSFYLESSHGFLESKVGYGTQQRKIFEGFNLYLIPA